MLLLAIALGALVTWRISHMLLRENGPFELFRRARIWLGVAYYDDDAVLSFKYEITVCIWCLSMWVGGAVVLLLWLAYSLPWIMFALLPYSYSAIAVMIDKHYGLVK